MMTFLQGNLALVLGVFAFIAALFTSRLSKDERHRQDVFGAVRWLGLITASALYAAVSSLLVWKLAPTPKRVFAVHGGVFCAVAAFYGLPRLYYLVAR